MKKSNVERLMELAALKSALQIERLSRLEAPSRIIRARLSELEDRNEESDSLSWEQEYCSRRDRRVWETWRLSERKRLFVELANHEAKLLPIRAKAARDVARQVALRRLRDQLGR